MYRGKFERKPAPAAEKASAAKRPKKGTIVFYSIYCLLIAAILVSLLFGLNWLQGWLVRYETSQPAHKAAEVFDQLFAKPDWAELYDLAGIQDTVYEDSQIFAAYMSGKVGGQSLTYEETAAGLSGDRKYIVYLAEEKIATFTLTGGSDVQTDISTWELGEVSLQLHRAESVLVEKLPEHTVYINGVPLDSSHTVRIISTAAETMLPEGIHGYRMEQQYLDGLLMQPQITVKDAQGNPVNMTTDPETGIQTPALPEAAPMTEDDKAIIMAAAEAHSKFSIRDIPKSELQQYIDRDSDIYHDIVTTNAYVQSFESYDFLTDENTIQDFYRYSDSLFSARVVMTMRVNRSGARHKDFPMNTTYFFTKQADGRYLVTDMTNVPMQERQEQVRLTFLQDDQIISTQMVDSNAASLTLPNVTAPEGQVLKGWAVQEDNGEGKITMTIVLVPGQNGVAQLNPEKPLEPMALYPIFEKESA